ncbi:MAG TPA: asparaginase domain-containing protein [Candidatus Dojkabacteria bacterium]|jgi:L-asparaginase
MKIHFIQTGGTIDKVYPMGLMARDYEIREPAFMEMIRIWNPNFEYSYSEILKKDSLDIDDKDREKILKECKTIDVDRIVITHGTDTMVDTAKVLSQIKDKTIVLTGSFSPFIFKTTDAELNFASAVIAAQLKGSGIYITMNGKIYEWDKVEKNKSGDMFIEKH